MLNCVNSLYCVVSHHFHKLSSNHRMKVTFVIFEEFLERVIAYFKNKDGLTIGTKVLIFKFWINVITPLFLSLQLLRDTFIFKIVPMLNPDGVIVGNYRCSLTGRDLNRNYKTVLKDSFPSVWYCKNMIRKWVAFTASTKQCRQTLLYIHSFICQLKKHFASFIKRPTCIHDIQGIFVY